MLKQFITICCVYKSELVNCHVWRGHLLRWVHRAMQCLHDVRGQRALQRQRRDVDLRRRLDRRASS